MSFAIVEIKDSKKSVTGYVDTHIEFKHRLEQQYPKAKFHQSMSIKDLKNNTIFKKILLLLTKSVF